MKQWIPFVLLLSVCFGASGAVGAGEVTGLPGAVEIGQALERGKVLRAQTGVMPEALMKAAVILKAGDIRCGFTLVKIEDAKGYAGATYRLTEHILGCAPRGNDMEVVEYTGVLFLDADLGLLSGSQNTTKTVSSGKNSEKQVVTADMIVKGGELSWVRKEKRADDPEFIEKSDPVKLHGIKPIPHNALICMAAFAAKQPGFKAGISSPFCVPSLDTGGTIDSFLIQPAWLETDLPKDKTNPAAKLVLRMRILEGELSEKGMSVEPPTVESWADFLEWTFDSEFRVGALPSSPEALITAEMTDPDTLDVNAPMDYVKIRKAFGVLMDKETERKAKKERDENGNVTKVPLK